MAVFISPGVYTTELDFSLYVPRLATTIFAMVGTAPKGPTNERTYITDEGNFIETFGEPSSDHLAMLAAIRYLRAGRQLWFVRVATYDVAATGYIRNSGDTANSVTMTAVSTGSWGNNITVAVAAGTNHGYKLTISYNSVPVEQWDDIYVGAAYVNDSDYIETRINGNSDYISVVDDEAQATLSTSLSVSMSGGDDGAPADDSDVIGTVSGNTRTGLQLFADPDSFDCNLIAAPGRWEKNIVAELLSICESRGDCMCFIDPPYGLTVQQVVDWHNGQLTGNSDYLAAALNSSYGALYYPWVQVYDGYSDANLWIPPCGHAAGRYAFTDYTYDPWYAPAGWKRGRLVDVLDVEHSPSLGERDFMQMAGNNVNPIVNFPTDGIMIYGQKTLQKATTALRDINVRRMLLYARKTIATATRYLVFEPNDARTWDAFVDLVTPTLRSIKSRRGLYDFRVICDSTTNTPDRINNDEMLGKILVQPTRTAEIIEVQFSVLSYGANFEEFA